MAGQVWHRSRRQFALTAEAYGDGLMLITDVSPSDKRPHGGGSITVTTYGLDAAAFEALHTRWRDWWRARFAEGMTDEFATGN